MLSLCYVLMLLQWDRQVSLTLLMHQTAPGQNLQETPAHAKLLLSASKCYFIARISRWSLPQKLGQQVLRFIEVRPGASFCKSATQTADPTETTSLTIFAYICWYQASCVFWNNSWHVPHQIGVIGSELAGFATSCWLLDRQSRTKVTELPYLVLVLSLQNIASAMQTCHCQNLHASWPLRICMSLPCLLRVGGLERDEKQTNKYIQFFVEFLKLSYFPHSICSGEPTCWHIMTLEPLQCYLPDFWGAQKLDDNSDACGSAMKTCFGRVPLCTQMHVKARVKCRQLLDTDTSPVIPSRSQTGFARVNQHNQTNQCKSQFWKTRTSESIEKTSFLAFHSSIPIWHLCCLTRIEP